MAICRGRAEARIAAAAFLFWGAGMSAVRAIAQEPALKPVLSAEPPDYPGSTPFQFYADHCAAGQYTPAQPHSDASGWGLGTSAWAESGACFPYPIAQLLPAARAVEVMTWGGVTKILSFEDLPLADLGPSALSGNRIDYEARHYAGLGPFKSCHDAQWPMQWIFQLADGTPQSPHRIIIDFQKLPGGNSDGGYIKRMSGTIEFLSDSHQETSVHMRFEVTAPGQSAEDSSGAVLDYLDRLGKRAAGQALPIPAADPECPAMETR